MAVKILLTSQKGGTGVSTCTLGIGGALAALGYKTLLVDGDSSGTGLMYISGCTQGSAYTLSDYMGGACRAKQTVLKPQGLQNVYLLPACGCNDGNILARAVTELEGLFDYVLLDTVLAKLSDRAIVVTEPYLPSIKSADRCIGDLRDKGYTKVAVLVNKVSGPLLYEGKILPPAEIAYMLHSELAAVIPEDLSLPLGKCQRATERAFQIAAETVSGKKKSVYKATRNLLGISGFCKRKLRTILSK
jgi:septum site-determining protein MinD